MRAEVKLGLGVSAVICTVVGGYFMFGRQKESNIPVNGTPVAATTPAKPGTPNKTDAAKTPATTPNKGRTTPQTKPTTPTTSNPRLASGQPGGQPGVVQPNTNPTDAAHTTRTFPAATTTNPNPTPTTNPTTSPTTPATSTENPTLAAGQPKPVWPPANNETKTDTVASRTPTDQPATQGPPAMPQTTLSATSPTPPAPSSELNQPVKSPTPADSNVSDPRNTLTSMQPNRVPPPAAQPTVGSNPTTNPQPTTVPPTPVAGDAKLTSMKTDDAAVETHKVQPGDTFAKLAESYYGDAKLEQFLKESNKDLGDPRRLSVGMIVKIPPKPGVGSSKQAKKESKDANDTKDAAKPAAEKSKSTGAKTYTVKSGDSFYSIAKAQLGNSARWKQLYALNKKTVDNDPTNLRPGQVLKLPEEDATKSTP